MYFRPSTSFALPLAFVMLGTVALSTRLPAHAATFTPDCTVPSLVAAITTANGNGQSDLIRLPAGCTYTLTAINSSAPQNVGPNGLPVIRNDNQAGADLTIDGNGAIIERGSAAPDFRILSADTDVTLAISNLMIRNGRATGEGGGIHQLERGTLTLDQVTLTGNSALGTADEDGGGALFIKNGTLAVSNSTFSGNTGGNGGALKNLLTDLTLSGTIFSQNSATLSGGTSNGGGAIAVDGANPQGTRTITISSSTFTANTTRYQGGTLMLFLYGSDRGSLADSTLRDNQAQAPTGGSGSFWGYGGALWVGGGGSSYIHTLRGLTISGNTALRGGGALYIQGQGRVDLLNSTLTGNRAANPASVGDGLGGAVFASNGSNTLNNVTLADNFAGGDGGGIFGGNATITNSIFAHNTADNGGPKYGIKQNCASGGFSASPPPYFAGARNLQYPPKSSEFNNGDCTANILTGDPLLDALKDNGGTTQTRGLLTGSGAINMGNPVTCLPTDQRGAARVGTCDLGAFEFSATPPTTATPTTTPTPALMPRVFLPAVSHGR